MVALICIFPGGVARNQSCSQSGSTVLVSSFCRKFDIKTFFAHCFFKKSGLQSNILTNVANYSIKNTEWDRDYFSSIFCNTVKGVGLPDYSVYSVWNNTLLIYLFLKLCNYLFLLTEMFYHQTKTVEVTADQLLAAAVSIRCCSNSCLCSMLPVCTALWNCRVACMSNMDCTLVLYLL